MDISDLLAFSVKNQASDLHLSADMPPMIRVHGDIRKINLPVLDHALFNLYTDGLITYEDALLNADSENDLRLKIKLAFDATKAQMPAADLAQINVV